LGNRQTAQVARLFQDKLNEGIDPFYLFSMIIRQFRLLVQTRSLLDGGDNPATIASQLKVRPFVAEKLARQARGYTFPQLEQIYRRLLQIDVEAKTGQADLVTALHLFVAGLTVETSSEIRG
jgi:DNA polymerase-3 subunit delta